jgi:uncharacterized protein (DUF849 family)
VLLKAAINGARPPGSHPSLPTTPVELAWAATAAVQAGAGAVHLHVRGDDRLESLDPDAVARTLDVVRQAKLSVGVGISTGLWITKDAARRLKLVRAWTTLPDFASVNFSEEGAPELAEWLIGKGVGVEAGAFDAPAATVLVKSGLANRCLRILIEPRDVDVAGALKTTAGIEKLLDAASIRPPRLLHGRGRTAWPLVSEATRRGYDTRAGLEDMLDLPDGRRAPDNASILAEAKRLVAAAGRP